MSEFIVAIYGGKQFLTGGGGDPGRTCVKKSAKKYKSEWALRKAWGLGEKVA